MNLLWIIVIQLVCVLLLINGWRSIGTRKPSDYEFLDYIMIPIAGICFIGGFIGLFMLYDSGAFGRKFGWLAKEF